MRLCLSSIVDAPPRQTASFSHITTRMVSPVYSLVSTRGTEYCCQEKTIVATPWKITFGAKDPRKGCVALQMHGYDIVLSIYDRTRKRTRCEGSPQPVTYLHFAALFFLVVPKSRARSMLVKYVCPSALSSVRPRSRYRIDGRVHDDYCP